MWNRFYAICSGVSLCQWFAAFLILGCCFYSFDSLRAQAIPCDGAYYLFLTPHGNARTSSMYRVTTSPASGEPEYQLVSADLGHRVTAAGYSVWQERIYALDYYTHQVLRIDGNGNVEAFVVPLYLDTTLVFWAGDVSPSGGHLLVVGRDEKKERDVTMFSIRLFTNNFIAGLVSVQSDFAISLQDIASDPLRGVLYGYDAKANKLTWVDNFSGRILDYFSRNMTGVGNLGSLFFDRNGVLHGYGNSGGSEDNILFDVDKLQGKARQIAQGPTGRFSDGCSCPYTVRTFKTAQPQQVLPCTDITITYDIINHAGTAYSFVGLMDTLPPGFTIKEIIKKPLTGTVEQGIGGNVLHIKGIDMVLDTNRIIITVQVDENMQPGSYASKASIGEIPKALGGTIFSDDPTTGIMLDATVIEVLGEQEAGALIQQQPLCDSIGMQLSSNIKDAVYQWNTGETTAAITITNPGLYKVSITANCATLVDSVLIGDFPPPLQVELPENITIDLGETLTNITPEVNKSSPLQYFWQAADSSALVCPNCETLTARPAENSTYSVTVTDANGCQASDFIQVNVVPVREVFAPSAFSPNNDGVNDLFYLQGKGDAKIIYLRIFDRWGNQVFESQNGNLNDKSAGWNGTLRGKLLPNQPFLYLAEIEFLDGVRKRLSGEVSLFR